MQFLAALAQNSKLKNLKTLSSAYFFRSLFFKNSCSSNSYALEASAIKKSPFLGYEPIKSVFYKRKPVVYLTSFLFLFFIGINTVNAQKTWDGGGDGVNWNSANNWNPNGVPTSSDAVTLAAAGSSGDNLSVTVNITNAVCASLQIGGSSAHTRATLTFASSGSPKLTVTNAVTVGGTGSTNANRGGTITFVSGATLEAGTVVLTQTTANDDNPGTITMTSGSTLITGSFSLGQGEKTWTPSTGTVNIKSTTTLPTTVFTTFGNLIISQGTTTTGVALTMTSLTVNSADEFSLSHDVTANAVSLEGGCAVTGGKISGSSTLTLGGDVTVTDNTGGTAGATISCPVALGANRTITVADDGTTATDLTMTGVISGSFGITKAGAGTWTLSGLNTYTGATTVSAGTLKAGVATTGSNGAFGFASAVTMANVASAILDITGFNNNIGSITGGGATGGNVTLGAATLTIGSNGTSPAAYAGIISGTGAITKTGNGTLILSGTNTYTGLTTVSSGILNVQNAQGTGTTAGGVTVSNGAALYLQGSITVGAETLSIGNTGIGGLKNISGNNTWGGTVTLTDNGGINSDAGTLTLSATNAITGSNRNLTLGAAGNIIVSGTITTGSGTLTKNGSGTVTLSGANTYTGATTVSAGILKMGNNAALGTSAGATTVSSGGTLELNGFTTSDDLTLNGTGTGGIGALANNGSYVSHTTRITLGSSSSIITNGSGGMFISNANAITGAYDLTLGGTSTR